MKFFRFTLFLVVLLAAAGLAQAQANICRVITSWADYDAKAFSSNELVGQFYSSVDDEQTTKLFQHQESGVAVSVGVEYVKGMFKSEADRITLALAFSGKPEAVFDETDSAEAEAVHDKYWKSLLVRKNIKVANRIYTFSFLCERERKVKKH